MARSLEDRKVASRYTQALFEEAEAQGVLKEVFNDLTALQHIATGPDFDAFFGNPGIAPSEKQALVEQQFKKGVQALTYRFLCLLLENNRMGLLSEVATQFTETLNAKNQVATADVITATELPEALEAKLSAQLQKLYGYKTVQLNKRVDPLILGGVIVKLNDQVIDGSYVGKLEAFRKHVSV